MTIEHLSDFDVEQAITRHNKGKNISWSAIDAIIKKFQQTVDDLTTELENARADQCSCD